MHERQPDDPIFAACRRIQNIKDAEEQYNQWLLLWQQYLKGGKLHTADWHQAFLISLTGHTIALRQGRYRDALRLINALMTHPQYSQADAHSRIYLTCFQMTCLLRLGKEAQAAWEGRSLLATQLGSQRQLALALIFVHLNIHFSCVKKTDKSKRISSHLTEFVQYLAQELDPTAVWEPLPQRATYGQLVHFFQTVHPAVMAAFQHGGINPSQGL